jgi:type IV secretory pathway TrbD component
MKCNVGGTDRTIRIALGVLLAVVGLFAQLEMMWRVLVLVIAVILLATAIVRYCPINDMLNVDTSKGEEKK